MGDGGIVVSGGAGGIVVAIGDLEAGARVLAGVAGALLDIAPPVPLDPEVLWEVARAGSARIALSGDLQLLSLQVAAVAEAYAQAEVWTRHTAELARLPVAAATRLVHLRGATQGWFDDGTGVVVREVPVTGEARLPASLAGLIAAGAEVHAPGDGRFRVVQVTHADRTTVWLVLLPGTQEWDPHAGDNPWDLTTDVVAVDGAGTWAAAGVRTALLEAMADAGREGMADPVLVAGHSQGGIVGTQLVSDPALAGHPLTLVAAGSPISALAVPDRVQVLSLEHREDIVPDLDGMDDPDAANRTTVTRSVPVPVDPATRIPAAHDVAGYVVTAALADVAVHSSLVAFRERVAPVLGSDPGTTKVVTHDYTLTRVGPGEAKDPRRPGAGPDETAVPAPAR